MKTAVLRKNGTVVVEVVEQALGLRDRMVGLLGRDSLGPGRGMFLSPCNSIHTFLMRFDLDLVFLDTGLVVTRIVRNVQPNRMVFGGAASRSVVELGAGWLPADILQPGDSLQLESF